EEDAQHHEQLDADEQHPHAHPGAERDSINRERLAAKAGERGARVGERIHPDAEPRDAVAAADSDEAENQDDDDADRLEVLEHAEVQHDDDANEDFKDQDELAL